MDNNWKAVLSDTLKRIGVIKVDMTGKIVVNFNQGGITDIEKTERIK